MINPYTILDLDNCISDDSWRVGLIVQSLPDAYERYEAYHELCEQDTFRNAHIVPRQHNLIFTARPETFREHTVRWLTRNGIAWTHMLMRARDDHRSSVDVKRDMLLRLAALDISKEQIVRAYDDHMPVVRMYREQGIHAIQVFINEPNEHRKKLTHPMEAE